MNYVFNSVNGIALLMDAKHTKTAEINMFK